MPCGRDLESPWRRRGLLMGTTPAASMSLRRIHTLLLEKVAFWNTSLKRACSLHPVTPPCPSRQPRELRSRHQLIRI